LFTDAVLSFGIGYYFVMHAFSNICQDFNEDMGPEQDQEQDLNNPSPRL